MSHIHHLIAQTKKNKIKTKIPSCNCMCVCHLLCVRWGKVYSRCYAYDDTDRCFWKYILIFTTMKWYNQFQIDALLSVQVECNFDESLPLRIGSLTVIMKKKKDVWLNALCDYEQVIFCGMINPMVLYSLRYAINRIHRFD